MEIKYRWERNECYMLVDAGGISADHYQIRMLENNRIDGLLKIQLQQINQQSEFCYTISGRQSMAQKYENSCLSVEEMKKLMAALNKTAGQLEDFLLNIDSLRLEPEWIYWKEDRDELPEFCYYPEETPEKSFREHMRMLLQYLLNKISHKDPDAVNAAYGLYQIGVKETFRMQELMQFLFYGMKENEESGEEESSLPGLWESAEYKNGNVYKTEDYEMFDEGGSRKRERKKQRREQRQEQRQEQQRQRRNLRQCRLADCVLSLLVAALAAAAVLRLAFLWYGRRAIMSEKETVIYIGLLCAIVVMSGIAIYKLMISKDTAATAIGEAPKKNMNWDQPQDYDHGKRTFAEEYPMSKLKNSKKAAEYQNHPFQWETISECQSSPLYEGKEQKAFPGETCVLAENSGPMESGWWFRYQGTEKNIEDFFLKGREGRIMVGKKLKAPDISLNRPTVSRHHAVFQVRNGICTVMDDDSTNGTYLDGNRLDREEARILLPGSELKFADVVFRIEKMEWDGNATTVLTGL